MTDDAIYRYKLDVFEINFISCCYLAQNATTMSKQPASKKRRLTGPTMLTNWLGKNSQPTVSSARSVNESEDRPIQTLGDQLSCIQIHDEKSTSEESSQPPTHIPADPCNQSQNAVKDTKKRKTGFDKMWLKKFPWLKSVNEGFGRYH